MAVATLRSDVARLQHDDSIHEEGLPALRSRFSRFAFPFRRFETAA
jgi:hypothetical protein